MRTTVNIADDVLHAAKERARREKRSVGEVLSELARDGLLRAPGVDEVAEEGSLYGFDPLPRRGAAVSNELIDQLREEEGE